MIIDTSKLGIGGRYVIAAAIEKICGNNIRDIEGGLPNFEEGEVKEEMKGFLEEYRKIHEACRQEMRR